MELKDLKVNDEVLYWHDRDHSFPLTVDKVYLDADGSPTGLIDGHFSAGRQMLHGAGLGDERAKVRHSYGSRTAGTWDFPDTPVPPPEPDRQLAVLSEGEMIAVDATRDAEGKIKLSVPTPEQTPVAGVAKEEIDVS